jgi:hypothetical protein
MPARSGGLRGAAMNSDNKILKVIQDCDSIAAVARASGMSRQSVSRAINRLNLDTSHFKVSVGGSHPNFKDGLSTRSDFCSCGREKDIRAKRCAVCARCATSIDGIRIASDKEVVQAVKNSKSYLSAAKKIGTSISFVTASCKRLGIPITHFTPFRGRPTPNSGIFKDGHPKRIAFRDRFYNLDPSKYFCAVCGQLPEWQGKPLTLEIHHINGIPTDNRLENLQWICPHCHAQTINHRDFNHRYKKVRNDKGY